MKKLTLLLACLMALILNGPVFSSVQAASSVKQESLDKASAALKEIPDNKKITALGGAKISEEKLKSLKSAIKSISPSGTGIVLLDLKSGKGLSYNAGQSFYSASTMKGPFVASLASAQPSAISASNGNVTATIRWSSNEDYMSLVNRYGKNCMKQWCKKAGVRTSLATHPYTNVSAGELAKLWLQNYIFFNSSSFGKSVGSLYTSPNLSVLHSVLGKKYRTQTKAGWIAGPSFYSGHYRNATNDAGIIYGKHPYLVVVLSNVPYNFSRISRIVTVLGNIADEL